MNLENKNKRENKDLFVLDKKNIWFLIVEFLGILTVLIAWLFLIFLFIRLINKLSVVQFWILFTIDILIIILVLYYTWYKLYKFPSFLQINKKNVSINYLDSLLRVKKFKFKTGQIKLVNGQIRSNYHIYFELKDNTIIPLPIDIWQTPNNLIKLRSFLLSREIKVDISEIWFAKFQFYFKILLLTGGFVYILYSMVMTFVF